MEDENKYFKWFIYIGIGIIVICILFPIIVRCRMGGWGESGTFSDTYAKSRTVTPAKRDEG